ncbi:MAG: alcohol dehydrogenase catalytic domain-containing protein, partial [bacterium]
YKDGLSTTEKGKVARIDPLIPGVDLAGTVVESSDASIAVGSKVIAHGNDIGVAHNGGFATMARVPAKWVIPVPAGLTTKTAMMVGTAGFTAAMSVDALERAGLKTGTGPVIVTGATGGVG